MIPNTFAFHIKRVRSYSVYTSSVSSVVLIYLYYRNCYGMLYCLCSGIRCNFTCPNVNNKSIILVQVNDECTVLMKALPSIQYCNLKKMRSQFFL